MVGEGEMGFPRMHFFDNLKALESNAQSAVRSDRLGF